MKDDPVTKRVRSVRHAISQEQGHDPHKLVAYYIQKQKAHGDRLREPVGRTTAAPSEQT
jgi:hypothetical protein